MRDETIIFWAIVAVLLLFSIWAQGPDDHEARELARKQAECAILETSR